MHRLKKAALSSYYYSTLPWRRLTEWHRTRTGRCVVRVLFYHRVSDVHPTPWTIGRTQFAEQIHWLMNRFRIVSLADAQRAIASGKIHQPMLAITFDDGYAENCDFAIPLLLRLRVPFTYFVTTQNVLEQIPFLHDLELGLSLRPNTSTQIISMARAGVEIGAHTRTHRDLAQIESVDALRDEITGSRSDLQQLITEPVRYFAFPFGQHENLSQRAFQVAYEAGFSGVCSAYGGVNTPGADEFHFERMHGDPEIARIRNWLTLDPRRHLSRGSFDGGDYRRPLPPPSPIVEVDSRPSILTAGASHHGP